MTNEASRAFGAYAQDYDEARRRLVPDIDAYYGAVIDALRAMPPGAPKRILDLGAGTGLLTGMIAEALGGRDPIELVVHDGSAEMLEQARVRLAGVGAVEYVVADLRDPLPGGPYCAVVSALAIHHLEDADKRDLYARVLAALKPGGVFANADQVLGETDELTAAYLEWHRREAFARGTDEEEWAAALERFELDRCATTQDQLDWLREIGFEGVCCTFVRPRFSTFVARAPAAG